MSISVIVPVPKEGKRINRLIGRCLSRKLSPKLNFFIL